MFAKVVTEEMSSYTDIASDFFTHSATTQGASKTASRIDRCLTSMAALDLMDRHPLAYTIGSVFEASLSDHVPVCFVFHGLEKKEPK